MELRILGTSDIKISPIIMGTWQAGKDMWVGIDDTVSIRAIKAAYDAGITTFDTAEVYGNGHSEKIVGNALQNVRDRVVIATKVFSNHLQYKKVIDACHGSLKNLNTDYIDLYQIHWPPGSFGAKKVPLEETMRAMTDLKTQGKIRAIGVSNFSRSQLEDAATYGRIDSLQPPYSLFWRKVETDAMPYCLENNITLLAYSSMAQGLLTGKFGPDHTFAKGDHRFRNKLFQPENYERVQKALDRLRPIATANHIILAQLALAWVISQPGTCAIAGARNPEQAVQNAAAANVRLSEEDIEAIDDIGKMVTDQLDDNPVMWEW
ncbi:MAG: aldo/keto reductase [Desulfobacteraceae bacterium]|nr:aldo/keto reductase [Desulfobacteraceae bacterium]MDH3837549.1 aldo/keto reductase [Desulfobacteraceae bacterium]MDH3874349.1 aldo/keto reductase [Desulfobacteraceae bacterium]